MRAILTPSFESLRRDADTTLLQNLERGSDGPPVQQDLIVIEVGPGRGVLTEPLSEAVGTLVAVELDDALAMRLQERFAGNERVTVVPGDVLTLTPAVLLQQAGLAPDTQYVVVGNLPYNIGAAILRNFLEAATPPERMVVMLQREVAESVCAAPGDLGLLGVSVQAYATARRLFNVPPKAFSPPPKVVSSVIELTRRETPIVPLDEREPFFATVRAGFSAPRKQLRNTLAQGLRINASIAEAVLASARIDASLRPALLSMDDWLRLSRVVSTLNANLPKIPA